MQPTLDLVADLAKKSGLVWIEAGGRTQAVWHELVGDAVCVVGDGAEQPLPDVTDGDTVTLLLRAKTNRQLAASVGARVEVVPPGSEHWDEVTAALKAGRWLLLPFGTVEAHGPHLAVGADLVDAARICGPVAERVGGLVAPAFPYGVCRTMRNFPGTVSLSAATFAAA